MTEELRFTVNISIGNEAMSAPTNVAAALRRIADQLEREGASGYFETIHDVNGNDVGRWKFGPVDHPGGPYPPFAAATGSEA